MNSESVSFIEDLGDFEEKEEWNEKSIIQVRVDKTDFYQICSELRFPLDFLDIKKSRFEGDLPGLDEKEIHWSCNFVNLEFIQSLSSLDSTQADSSSCSPFPR